VLMLAGSLLLVWGTFLPMISRHDEPLGRASFRPSVHADAVAAGEAPTFTLCSAAIAMAACLLALTRTRLVGFLWRKLAGLAIVVPLESAGKLWANLCGLTSSSDIAVLPEHRRHILVGHVLHATHPGHGLIMISCGCLATLWGCFVRPSKFRRTTVEYRVRGH
jgi:hypothetical protein